MLFGQRRKLSAAEDTLANMPSSLLPLSQVGVASSELGELLHSGFFAVIVPLAKLRLLLFAGSPRSAGKPENQDDQASDDCFVETA
jgi:hypothetical protein